MKQCSLAVAVLLGLTAPALAQTFFGSIVGTVTDTTGAVGADIDESRDSGTQDG